MSLLPFFNRPSMFDNVFDDWFFDRPMDLMTPFTTRPSYRRPRRTSTGNNNWTATLRLTGYKPEEVKVDRGEGNATVKVHAHQGSGDDFSEIKKTIHVPDNVDRDHLEVDFTRDGVLVVRAPYKTQLSAMDDISSSGSLMPWNPFGGWPLSSLTDEMRAMRDNMLQIAEQSFPGSVFPTFVQDKDGVTRLNMDFDLRGYKPEEITVSHKGDNVAVEAKHEKQHKDGSSSYKHFKQVFTLPKNVKCDKLQSKLLQDGRLQLEAPCEFKEKPQQQQAISESGVDIPVKRN